MQQDIISFLGFYVFFFWLRLYNGTSPWKDVYFILYSFIESWNSVRDSERLGAPKSCLVVNVLERCDDRLFVLVHNWIRVDLVHFPLFPSVVNICFMLRNGFTLLLKQSCVQKSRSILVLLVTFSLLWSFQLWRFFWLIVRCLKIFTHLLFKRVIIACMYLDLIFNICESD